MFPKLLRYQFLTISFLITIQLTACGESGSSYTSEKDTIGYNNGLEGYLYYSAADKYYELDLESGIARTLWSDADGDFWTITPSFDGQEFAVTMDDGIDKSRLVIIDRQGDILSKVVDKITLSGKAEISPDGELIAVLQQYYGSKPDRVPIFNRNGNIIQTYASDGINQIKGYTWHSDSSLFITENDSIFSAKPRTSEAPSLIKQFPGKLVSSINISRNGKQLAFVLANNADESEYHIYTSNLDGRNMRQLTDAEFASQGSPSWSPDGKFIALRHHVSDDMSGGSAHGTCPTIYIVRNDIPTVDLSQGETKEVFRLKRKDKKLTLPQPICAYSGIYWFGKPVSSALLQSPVKTNRFIDMEDGTVVENKTLLQWEKSGRARIQPACAAL
ncbi:TolB family protein [Hahella ganghwensis]|uniref:TolB family protein n=1 Tax=Hahella ganghwensis TaxID=286420 RepID=UPI00037EB635|nr:PD40 domain-containing protein [Hahella ganghwensis]